MPRKENKEDGRRSRDAIRLTKSVVDRLPFAPVGKQIIYWDAEMRGFGMRVTQGAKTYIVLATVAGKHRPTKVTIGAHGQPFGEQGHLLSADRARDEARIQLGQMRSGLDPNAAKKARHTKGITLQEVSDDFFRVRNLKKNTARQYRNVINNVFTGWLDVPVSEINRDAVQNLFLKIGGAGHKGYANLAIRILRALMNFAINQYEDARGNSVITTNPVTRLIKTSGLYKLKRRSGMIRDLDMPVFFKALDGLVNEVMRDYLTLVLLTGMRREEAASLAWTNVDSKNRLLTLADTKNDRVFVLPITPEMAKILARRKGAKINEFVFPSLGAKSGHIAEPKSIVKQVRNASGIHFTVHDLRRTFATAADAEVVWSKVKALLNHKMSGDVTAGYVIASAERVRPELEKVQARIMRLAGAGKKGKVVSLRP